MLWACILAGCGTSGGNWHKAGASSAERQSDIRACMAQAQVTNPRTEGPVIPNAGGALLVGVGYAIFEGAPHDMAIYRCMERKGWTDMKDRRQPFEDAR